MLLWSGQTISEFGSIIGRTAMSFVAILTLNATPLQMGILQATELLPAFLIGLFAGAWVDRLRRRPLLIGADIGRTLVLLTIPLAAALGVLSIEQVFIVAFLVSILTILFDIAYQSYLPALVGKDDLVEGNSKLAASASISEFSGFSLAGWLVQGLTAPFAVLIDAVTFIFSFVSIALIRTPEPKPVPAEQTDMRREIVEGLKTVYQHVMLRASAIAILLLGLSGGIYGSQVVLFMSRELGFSPGILTMIWAVGGVSSFIGAVLAPRFTRWLGVGWAMAAGLAIHAMTMLIILFANGANLISGIILILQQFGDGFYLVYEINQVSLRQGITEERVLGRVNATMRFLAIGGALAGALLGGGLAEGIGLRAVLFLGGILTIAASLVLGFSPLRGLKNIPVQPASE
jgi:predicted MFS family arabinose efflux permease